MSFILREREIDEKEGLRQDMSLFRNLCVAVASVALLLGGCASGPSSNDTGTDAAQPAPILTVTGSLTYQERIALPKNSVAVVELRDGMADTIISEFRIPLMGRQVPVLFEIGENRSRFPTGGTYVARGGVFVNGTPAWTTDLVPIDTNSQVPVDLGTLTMKRVEPPMSAWDCGDQRVRIGTSGDAMKVVIGEQAFELRQVTTASGARYEAVGDPTTYLWNKGENSMLVVRGKAYPECAPVPKTGRPFRALGNEPNWVIEIGPEMMVLTDHSRPARTSVPTPRPARVQGGMEYVAGSGPTEIRVLVSDKTCADTMSGMPYPKTVEVQRPGAATLRGCGGEPVELLLGDWLVQSIDGTAVAVPARGTLRFGTNGLVSGKAFCNSFTGPYTLTGEGLKLGNLASTMMACAEPLSRLEAQMHGVLRSVARFEIAADGSLLLLTNDGRRISATRASTK